MLISKMLKNFSLDCTLLSGWRRVENVDELFTRIQHKSCSSNEVVDTACNMVVVFVGVLKCLEKS